MVLQNVIVFIRVFISFMMPTVVVSQGRKHSYLDLNLSYTNILEENKYTVIGYQENLMANVMLVSTALIGKQGFL